MTNCDRGSFQKVVASDSGLVGCMQDRPHKVITFDLELNIWEKNAGVSKDGPHARGSSDWPTLGVKWRRQIKSITADPRSFHIAVFSTHIKDRSGIPDYHNPILVGAFLWNMPW